MAVPMYRDSAREKFVNIQRGFAKVRKRNEQGRRKLEMQEF